MRRPQKVEVDWLDLLRAFERLDPSWDSGPLPYLNLRTGKVTYFGESVGVDLADTLDFDRHAAIVLSYQALSDRQARMRAFAATVAEPELSARLRDALQRPGGVALFHDLLSQNPSISARWRRSEDPRLHELIAEWLRFEQLTTHNLPPWSP